MVLAIISKLDPHKAFGHDGIFAIVLKKYAPELSLNSIINTFLHLACLLVENPLL